MRLQLTIRRHALPPTNILWTVRPQDPTSTSAFAYATISQLLEDVNDIIPLESDDWGLEDYVVEVGGYECLHFQPIDSVLKEDDKITIRALQTGDLRVRQLGGRHQISPDGRHLFDGVAFGRPYLKKTARPIFRIPPRKRRKLDLGQGQYIEDDSIIQALLPESSSAADTALVVTDDGADAAIRDDNPEQIVTTQLFEDGDQDSANDQDYSDFVSSSEYEEDDEELELSEELKALLDDEPPERCDDTLGESNQSLNSGVQMSSTNGIRPREKRKRDEGSTGSTSGSNSPSIPTALRDTKIPDSSSTSVLAPGVGETMHSGGGKRRTLDDFEGSRATSHSSGTSFSGLDSSESEDLSGSADLYSSTSSATSSSTGSEPDTSESTSESDSESELESSSGSGSGSELGKVGEFKAAPFSSMRMKGGQTTEVNSYPSAGQLTIRNAPGKGLNRTHKNNQRLKKKKKLNSLKAAGLLPSDAGFKELSSFEQTESNMSMMGESAEQSGLHNALKARKQELLEGVATEAGSIPLSDPLRDSTKPGPRVPTYGDVSKPAQSVAATYEQNRTVDPNKRSKLDIESSRRMLFGALGLKTPKTPAAEQELREKLAKRSQISANVHAKRAVIEEGDDAEAMKTPVSVPTQPEEAWADKLILSAVECEAEGQILSKPPFPFVQHWQGDKQNSHLLGRLDERTRANAEGQPDAGTATDELGDSGARIDEDSVLDGMRLNGVIQSQLAQEAQELENEQNTTRPSAPDFPSITDFNVLEALKAEHAVAGAVIAFKQLDMSKETGWQPQISAYRLAEVQEVLEDGTLKVLLAERDRISTPLSFDYEAGKRKFEKFEMPIDADDLEPDTGVREIPYGDLIEPKLVERKSMGPPANQPTWTAHTSTNGSETDKGISQLKSIDYSIEQPSAQVGVSTPRKNEISELIKDAGFHSSFDSELLQPPREGPTTNRNNHSCLSPQMSDKQWSRPINLDGVADKPDQAVRKSPRLAGSESSSVDQDNDFFDSSSNSEPGVHFSSTCGSQYFPDSGSKKSVVYPRLSQLVLDESSADITNGKPQSCEARFNNSPEGDKSDLTSAPFGRDSDGLRESEESHLDSLKSTIPPSEDAAPQSSPPSATSSRITNPCMDGDASSIDGKASSNDDLPSISEITSTAQSGRVSPPQLKQVGSSKRKKSASPNLPSSPNERESTENRTETQTSSTFEPSQIPLGSQVVDLTFSSDPISPDHDDGEYGSRRRISQRIKQSSGRVKLNKAGPAGVKTGNGRLVRGRLGRAQHSL